LLSEFMMIEKSKIVKTVNEFIKGKDIFLVSVKVSRSNRIMVFVDTMKGIIIDECVALHRHIKKNLDPDAEDYELQISSPGIDMPFGVIEQYYKNEGKQVEVVDNEGSRFTGCLKNVTIGGFELETELKIKGKAKERKDISFNFDQVKSTKELFSIK
jgi:ribosome maturation factor RimP